MEEWDIYMGHTMLPARSPILVYQLVTWRPADVKQNPMAELPLKLRMPSSTRYATLGNDVQGLGIVFPMTSRYSTDCSASLVGEATAPQSGLPAGFPQTHEDRD